MARMFRQIYLDRDGLKVVLPGVAPFSEDDLDDAQLAILDEMLTGGIIIEITEG